MGKIRSSVPPVRRKNSARRDDFTTNRTALSGGVDGMEAARCTISSTGIAYLSGGLKRSMVSGRIEKSKTSFLPKQNQVLSIIALHSIIIVPYSIFASNGCRKGTKIGSFWGVPLKFMPSKIRVKIPRIRCRICASKRALHTLFLRLIR